MHTRCPACQAVFRIGRADLEVAGGRVRCGECSAVFDARAALQRELPLRPPPGAPQDAARQPELGLGQPESPARARRIASEGSLPGLLISEIESEAEEGPARTRTGWHLAAWGMVNLCLVAALAAQLLFIQRDAFAQDRNLRPVVAWMCDVAGCTLPSLRAVERIELKRRQVYAHPNVEDALLIDLTFVNNAAFAQPYPMLTVTLGDLRGEPVVRRHFAPREYEPRLGREARMAPGSPVNVVLEVHDPGAGARTFDLDFF